MASRIASTLQHMRTAASPTASSEPEVLRGFPYMMQQREKRTRSSLILGSSGPLEWYCLNDVVMGGQSVSSCEADDASGGLTFSGAVSTVGGGFCSCRTHDDSSLAPPAGSAAVTALKLRFTSDSALYKLTLSTGEMTAETARDRNRDLNWQYQLPEGAGSHTVTVPLTEMHVSSQAICLLVICRSFLRDCL